MRAKWALSLSSTGSKDYSTHNAPLFPGCNLPLFQSRESTVFKSWVRKVERTRRANAYIERAIRCSAFRYKARGKRTFTNMSATHDVLTAYLMRPLMFFPYI